MKRLLATVGAMLAVCAILALVRGAPGDRETRARAGRAGGVAISAARASSASGPRSSEPSSPRPISEARPVVAPTPRAPGAKRDYVSRIALDGPEADKAFEELLDDEEALEDPALLDALLALAADPRRGEHVRELALDVAGRSHAAAESAIARLRELALSNALGAEARTWAIAALRQIAADHPELEAPLRTALIDAATNAPTPEARADAVDGISTKGASRAEVARVTGFLQDPDAEVRAGAARALASSPAVNRHEVAGAIERALHAESEPLAGAALVTAALEVGRGDAAALLARLASAPLVRANPELARQIDDYRAALAAGETSVEAIERAHENREESRAR